MSTTTTGRSGRALQVIAVVAGGLGIVGAIAVSGIAIAADGSTSTHHSVARAAEQGRAASGQQTTGQATTGQPASAQSASQGSQLIPQQPANPVPAPSAAVASLQRQLGQLNYYEGPDDGLMGPQTEQAIKDLQRVAGLPQTGVMDPATDSALIHQLTFGDNQMGGD